jgi:hypothetical protein
MKNGAKRVTVGKGGFVPLSQEELTRLNVRIGDYLNVEEVGDRCIRLTKAKPDKPHDAG